MTARQTDPKYFIMETPDPGTGGFMVCTVDADGGLFSPFNGSLPECEQWIALEPFFTALPGGPAAVNNSNGEVWQYMGPFAGGASQPDGFRPPMYQFRHRSHPGHGGARVLAIVSPDTDYGEKGAVAVSLCVGPPPVEG